MLCNIEGNDTHNKNGCVDNVAGRNMVLGVVMHYLGSLRVKRMALEKMRSRKVCELGFFREWFGRAIFRSCQAAN